MTRLYVGLVAACLVSGCKLETALVVESDTAWSGTIDTEGNVSHRGNARYDLTTQDGREVCWVLKKDTALGTLRAYTEEESAFGDTHIRNVRVTTAPSGQVRGCTE